MPAPIPPIRAPACDSSPPRHNPWSYRRCHRCCMFVCACRHPPRQVESSNEGEEQLDSLELEIAQLLAEMGNAHTAGHHDSDIDIDTDSCSSTTTSSSSSSPGGDDSLSIGSIEYQTLAEFMNDEYNSYDTDTDEAELPMTPEAPEDLPQTPGGTDKSSAHAVVEGCDVSDGCSCDSIDSDTGDDMWTTFNHEFEDECKVTEQVQHAADALAAAVAEAVEEAAQLALNQEEKQEQDEQHEQHEQDEQHEQHEQHEQDEQDEQDEQHEQHEKDEQHEQNEPSQPEPTAQEEAATASASSWFSMPSWYAAAPEEKTAASAAAEDAAAPAAAEDAAAPAAAEDAAAPTAAEDAAAPTAAEDAAAPAAADPQDEDEDEDEDEDAAAPAAAEDAAAPEDNKGGYLYRAFVSYIWGQI